MRRYFKALSRLEVSDLSKRPLLRYMSCVYGVSTHIKGNGVPSSSICIYFYSTFNITAVECTAYTVQ